MPDFVTMSYSAFTRLKYLTTLAAGGDQHAAAQALGMLEALQQQEPVERKKYERA